MTDARSGLTLAGALARAVLAADSVPKTERNDYHRYAYASAESIIAEARTALAEQGLVATWSERHLDTERAGNLEIRGRKGATYVRVYAILVGIVRVSYAHSDEHLAIPVEWPVCLEAGRGADKAVGAACTSALSYVLRDLLLLPRVAEGEDIQARHDYIQELEPRVTGGSAARPPRERTEAQRAMDEARQRAGATPARSRTYEDQQARIHEIVQLIEAVRADQLIAGPLVDSVLVHLPAKGLRTLDDYEGAWARIRELVIEAGEAPPDREPGEEG